LLLMGVLVAMPAIAQEQGERQEEQWSRPDARAGIAIENTTKRPAVVRMYSQNRIGHKWGPWEVSPTHHVGGHPVEATITCKLDEYICMGAVAADETTSWGLGDGSQRCEECCFRCDNRWRGWYFGYYNDGATPFDHIGRRSY